jgi:hypothetical protein
MLAGFQAGNHPQQIAKRGAVDAVDDRGTDQAFFDSLSERFGGFTLDVAAAPHNAKTKAFYTLKDDGLAMPWGGARWQGPECFMCNGTGDDRVPILENDEARLTHRVVGYAENGLRCRACNGHGRQATTDALRGPERVWCNPPYSDCGAWVRKAWAEWRGTEPPALIVMLLPANRVEQAWWQDHVEPHRDKPGSPLRVEFLRGRMRFDRPGWTKPAKGDRPPFGCCLLIWSAPT